MIPWSEKWKVLLYVSHRKDHWEIPMPQWQSKLFLKKVDPSKNGLVKIFSVFNFDRCEHCIAFGSYQH